MQPFVFNFQVSPDDGLPDTICGDCLDKVRQSYEFKLKFEKSEFNWKQLNCDDRSVNEFLNCSNECEHYTRTRLGLIKKESETDYEQLETISLPEIIEPETVKPKVISIIQKVKEEPEIEIYMEDSDFNGTDTDEKYIRSDLQCSLCTKTFANKSNLKVHMIIHSGERPFQCEMCSKGFRNKHNLKIHVQRRHPGGKSKNDEFKCTVCSKVYTSRTYLNRHKIVHTEEELHQREVFTSKLQMKSSLVQDIHSNETTDTTKFKCTLCSKFFRSKYYLSTHMKIHTGEKPFQCGLCPEKFRLNERLKEHKQLKHTDDGIANAGKFKCSICSKLYGHKSTLDKHAKIHLGEKSLKCTVCSGTFRETVLKRHMRTQHKNIEVFKCEICSKVYHQKKVLKTHMLAIHKTENRFSCELCPNAFRLKSELKSHMKTTHPTYITKFKCATCSKLFGSQETLTLHMAWHKRQKPFKCEICLLKFRLKSNLIEHSRMAHTVRESVLHMFKCPKCSKLFKRRSSLNHHLKRPGEILFRCDICSQEFRCKTIFTRHRKTVHANSRRYKCDICSKSFRKRWGLKTHAKIHTGEKPFQCKFCPTRFLHKHNLGAHTRKVHGARIKVIEVQPS